MHMDFPSLFPNSCYTQQPSHVNVASTGNQFGCAGTFFIILKAKGEATLSMKLTRKLGTKGRRGSKCATTVPFVRGLPSAQTQMLSLSACISTDSLPREVLQTSSTWECQTKALISLVRNTWLSLVAHGCHLLWEATPPAGSSCSAQRRHYGDAGGHRVEGQIWQPPPLSCCSGPQAGICPPAVV